MLQNVLTDDIHIAKHSDCKKWLHFGRTEGSITNENIAYALMGTYGVFVTYGDTTLTHKIPNILSGRHLYGTKWL